MTPPIGWIPPRYREPIYGEITSQERADVAATIQIWDDELCQMREATPDELVAMGVKKVVGVRDTRTGKDHPNISGVLFTEIDV